jgi:hypothetical protein
LAPVVLVVLLSQLTPQTATLEELAGLRRLVPLSVPPLTSSLAVAWCRDLHQLVVESQTMEARFTPHHLGGFTDHQDQPH